MLSEFDDLRQGDIVDIKHLPVQTADRSCDWNPTPGGVVIISQTCDLVRSVPEQVTVAPLVFKPGPEASRLRKGQRPNLVHVPRAGDTAFAELHLAATVNKSWLSGKERRRGVVTDREISDFGKRVGRKYSRFALPDEVVPWFKPLESTAFEKYAKPSKPEGLLLELVEEFRVKVLNAWDAAPHDLTLFIVLKKSAVSELVRTSFPDMPDELSRLIRPGGALAQSAKLATELWSRLEDREAELAGESDNIDSSQAYLREVEIYWLWQAMGEAWAEKCKPRNQDMKDLSPEQVEAVRGAVVGQTIGFEVSTTEEFTMDDYLNSEMLDLAHLTPAVPLFRTADNSSEVPGERSAVTKGTNRQGLMSRLWDCFRKI